MTYAKFSGDHFVSLDDREINFAPVYNFVWNIVSEMAAISQGYGGLAVGVLWFQWFSVNGWKRIIFTSGLF